MGGILDLAKRDSNFFVTDGGFQEEITISTPDKSITLTLTGFATKHWINFDTSGNPVNSKNAHVTLSESVLTTNGYPVRNANGEVSLKNHLISFPDSSTVIKNYVVREVLPDETLGLIPLILGDYKQ